MHLTEQWPQSDEGLHMLGLQWRERTFAYATHSRPKVRKVTDTKLLNSASPDMVHNKQIRYRPIGYTIFAPGIARFSPEFRS